MRMQVKHAIYFDSVPKDNKHCWEKIFNVLSDFLEQESERHNMPFNIHEWTFINASVRII